MENLPRRGFATTCRACSSVSVSWEIVGDSSMVNIVSQTMSKHNNLSWIIHEMRLGHRRQSLCCLETQMLHDVIGGHQTYIQRKKDWFIYGTSNFAAGWDHARLADCTRASRATRLSLLRGFLTHNQISLRGGYWNLGLERSLQPQAPHYRPLTISGLPYQAPDSKPSYIKPPHFRPFAMSGPLYRGLILISSPPS